MDRNQAPPLLLQRAVLAVAALALLAASLGAIFGRSAWYDEYYTFYITRPGAPLPVLAQGWLRDNHPPLFYALAWATGWLGNDIPARRIVNLAFAALAGLALWRIARRREALRPALFFYAVGLAGALPFLVRVAELRSNFLAFAASAVAVAALAAFARPGRTDRSESLFLGLALALAFTVHLAASIILGCVALAFAARLVLLRDWPALRSLALVGLAAILPFALCLALQLGTIAGNTRSFWIPAGLAVARWTIQNETTAALTANLPLTLAGLAGHLPLLRRAFTERRLPEPLQLAATLGCGLALAFAVLVAVHLQRPFVIARYLVAIHPVLILILALGTAELARTLGRRGAALLALAVLAGSLLSLERTLRRTLDLPGWDGTAAAIAEEVRACRSTVIHPALAWNEATLALAPVDNRAVMPFAYHMAAARHGFAVEPPQSRRMSDRCPTLFWAEHVPGHPPAAADLVEALRAEGYPVTAGTVAPIGDGWLFTVAPPR